MLNILYVGTTIHSNLSNIIGRCPCAQGWGSKTCSVNRSMSTCLITVVRWKNIVIIKEMPLTLHKDPNCGDWRAARAGLPSRRHVWMRNVHSRSLFFVWYRLFAAFRSNRLSWQKWFVINGAFVTHLYPWTLTRPINSSACGQHWARALSFSLCSSLTSDYMHRKTHKQWLFPVKYIWQSNLGKCFARNKRNVYCERIDAKNIQQHSEYQFKYEYVFITSHFLPSLLAKRDSSDTLFWVI